MSSRGLPVTQKMREERRERAAIRQAAYDKLSIADRLARPNLGAWERAKLLKKQAKQAEKPTPKKKA